MEIKGCSVVICLGDYTAFYSYDNCNIHIKGTGITEITHKRGKIITHIKNCIVFGGEDGK